MDVKFTVGEFAKLCGVSRQALIFYDKENVIRPKFKDPCNGYRYYSADQLEQFDTIMILREMGLSLKEIKEHMKNRSLDKSFEILENQQKAVRRKIEELKTIEKRITLKIDALNYFNALDSSFKIVPMDEEILAVEKVKSPGGILEVDIALKKLIKKANKNKVTYFYEMGNCVPMESILKGDFIKFNCAFLPLNVVDESLSFIIKPKGLYAVKRHMGTYVTTGETYKIMLEEIKKAGMEIAGDSYEFGILDSLTTSNPQNYCTQIEIPVKKILR